MKVSQQVGSVAEGGRAIGAAISQVIGDVVIGLHDQVALQDRRNQELLIHRVESAWIKGVLEKIEAVHAGFVRDAGLIELHKRLLPDAVDYVPAAAKEVSHLEIEMRSLPADKQIVDIFEDMDRSLLILGEPGSGKTTTLLALARDAIRRAVEDPSEPIPVMLNLSSWVHDRASITDWVVYELNTTKYGVPKETGYKWLKGNNLLLLLDGLDEVVSRYREDCIAAINEFSTAFGLTGLAVCCRSEEYLKVERRLRLRGAILLEALTEQQMDAYFDAAGPSLAGLRAALHDDVGHGS